MSSLLCGETFNSVRGLFCCCSLRATLRPLDLLIKNKVRGMWASLLCGRFAPTSLYPCFLCGFVKVVRERGLWPDVFFDSVAYRLFLRLALLCGRFRPRVLQTWFLRWIVQVVFRRGYVGLRHSAAVFALGVERYGFCLGSCRSLCEGVKVVLFHSAAVLLLPLWRQRFCPGSCRSL